MDIAIEEYPKDMNNRHNWGPDPKFRIASKISALIRRRRIPLAKVAALLGISAEDAGQILVGGRHRLSEVELADALGKLQAWIDPGTFGDTQAAVNLAEILSEINDPGLTRTVSRFMARQSEAIKALGPAPPGHGRNILAALLRSSWDQALPGVSGTVRSHAMNVLIARWRLLQGVVVMSASSRSPLPVSTRHRVSIRGPTGPTATSFILFDEAADNSYVSLPHLRIQVTSRAPSVAPTLTLPYFE